MADDAISDDEAREHRDLAKVFESQGFDQTWAELLAAAHVPPEEAQRLLARDASHELAGRILV